MDIRLTEIRYPVLTATMMAQLLSYEWWRDSKQQCLPEIEAMLATTSVEQKDMESDDWGGCNQYGKKLAAAD